MEKKIFFLDLPYMRNKFYLYAEYNRMRPPSAASRINDNQQLIKVCKRGEDDVDIMNFKNHLSQQVVEEVDKYEIYEGYDGGEDTLCFHYHNMAELSIILSGEGYYFVQGQAIKVQKGDIIFFNSLTPHAWCSLGDRRPEQITFSFYPTLLIGEELEKEVYVELREFIYSIRYLNQKNIHAEKNFQLWMEVYHEYMAQEIGYTQLIKFAILTFFTYELRRREDGREEKQRKSVHRELDQALTYIKRNFRNKITIDEVAKQVYMHPNYFSSVFKKKYKISFSEYINELKVNMAIELMKSTQLSIEEVAIQSGFTSLSNFYKAFKKAYNMSPRQYLKK